MGIQIYLSIEALEAKGVKVKFHNDPITIFCACGCSEKGFCDCCGGNTYDTFSTTVKLSGLPFRLNQHGGNVWCDANHWGDNRGPVMELINNHNLIEGNDWYEA